MNDKHIIPAIVLIPMLIAIILGIWAGINTVKKMKAKETIQIDAISPVSSLDSIHFRALRSDCIASLSGCYAVLELTAEGSTEYIILTPWDSIRVWKAERVQTMRKLSVDSLRVDGRNVNDLVP